MKFHVLCAKSGGGNICGESMGDWVGLHSFGVCLSRRETSGAASHSNRPTMLRYFFSYISEMGGEDEPSRKKERAMCSDGAKLSWKE